MFDVVTVVIIVNILSVVVNVNLEQPRRLIVKRL